MVWWWLHSDIDIETSRGLDEALVTFHMAEGLAKGRSLALFAGVELALPHVKRQLPWYKLVVEDASKQQGVYHALGMPRVAALVLSVYLSQTVSALIGACVYIQQARGLRPSEILNLLGGAINLPEDNMYRVACLTLGMGGATKSGRPEFVMLETESEDPICLYLCRWLKHVTPAGSTVSRNLSVSAYSSVISKASVQLEMPRYTAHGPRAGFVSDQTLKGVPRQTIKQITRHSSDKSLGVYIDSISHLNQLHSGPLRVWIDTARLIETYPQAFFPQLTTKPVQGVLETRFKVTP